MKANTATIIRMKIEIENSSLALAAMSAGAATNKTPA